MIKTGKIFGSLLTMTFLISSVNMPQAKAEQTDENRFLKNIKQLTFEGEKNGEAYFSPDGQKVIFQGVRDKDKYYQIYTMNVDGSGVKMVSPGFGKTTCAYFSADGKHIIFSSSHLDPSSVIEKPKTGRGYEWDFEGSMDIFQAFPDGNGLVRLTDTKGYDAEATYSNDGKKIIFTSQRDGDLELYVMNADGSEQKRITNRKGYDGGAFFSPDDKKIVYRGFDERGNAQIYIANADGTDTKQLTSGKGINWCPYFHPNGKHIIFSSNMKDSKNFELYMMDLDGKNVKQITNDKNSDVLPVFSPDGQKLMWTSTRTDGKSQIFIADFDMNEASELSSSAKEIYKDIRFLASDELEGRRAGTAGADKAAEYIKNEFQKAGLTPGGDKKKSYFQKFEVSTGVSLGKDNSFTLNGTKINSKDYTPLSFSDNGKISGELVFAGYGITAPEYHYDDYDDLDVKDKIVMVMRHEPQETKAGSVFNGNKPTPYSEIRYKAFNARRNGAKGLVLINGPVNYASDEDNLISLKNSGGTGTIGLPVIQIKNEIAEKLFNENGKDLKKIQAEIDTNLSAKSFALSKNIEYSVDLIRDLKETTNVIGVIEGSDKKLKEEMIIIGAHYDHLGHGGEESLAGNKTPEIHNGADDNASGVAGVIELAKRIKEKKLKRSVAFMAFSGEELGLLGSSYFTNNSSLDNVITMINMDMIGRLNEDKLYVGGIKTGENFEDLLTELNKEKQFKLSFFKDGYGPSDHMSFYLKDIPVLFFFTGVHNDYHKPGDDYYKLNISGLEKIIGLIENVTYKIADNSEKPKLVKLDVPVNTSEGTGKSYGGYLGTIPDYTSDMNAKGGVKLSGVKEGGPAAIAGMKSGDVIVKFDEISINNLYDYTFALRTKKPGDKVRVIANRNGSEMVFEIEVGKR